MLRIKKVSKIFNSTPAVDELSFEADSGEILGFLGPNGAGKTTTMRIISGHLIPTIGDVEVCGYSIIGQRLAAQENIGYVPENAPLYEEMYVLEFLEFISSIRKIDKDHLQNRLEYVLKTCDINDVVNKKIETLSKGYKRRVSLATALISNPNVLILDEPTDGLDPNQKYHTRNLIKELAKEKCVIVSTHILEEVEEICSRVIIIGKGKKLFEGTPLEMKNKSSKNKIQDVFRALTTNETIEGVSI